MVEDGGIGELYVWMPPRDISPVFCSVTRRKKFGVDIFLAALEGPCDPGMLLSYMFLRCWKDGVFSALLEGPAWVTFFTADLEGVAVASCPPGLAADDWRFLTLLRGLAGVLRFAFL